MNSQKMTLVERLQNPAWESDGAGKPARLNIEQTRQAMTEAAEKIERLRKHGGRVRQALKSVVDHWHEFGPEHGFEETINRAERVPYMEV